MIPYRKNSRKATASTEYARGLTIAAHPKSQWVFEDLEFQDRAPDEQSRRLGDIAEDVTHTTAQRAVRHWTKKAALALTPGERDEALSIARSIAQKAGLDWPGDCERAA